MDSPLLDLSAEWAMQYDFLYLIHSRQYYKHDTCKAICLVSLIYHFPVSNPSAYLNHGYSAHHCLSAQVLHIFPILSTFNIVIFLYTFLVKGVFHWHRSAVIPSSDESLSFKIYGRISSDGQNHSWFRQWNTPFTLLNSRFFLFYHLFPI